MMRWTRWTRDQQPALTLFAAGLIGLGILALIYGDFAMFWQPVAPWVPGRTALAYASGILMVLCGAGLLFTATVRLAIRILFPYLVLWTLLKVPALFAAPTMEAVWLGIGELCMLLAGGWTLFAALEASHKEPANSTLQFLTGVRGIRAARILFGVAVLPVGLSHIFYVKQTIDLVPAWLPYRIGWAYLTGVGQMACGLGMLLSGIPTIPRIAATTEAIMLSIFAALVWAPAVIAHPNTRLPWTAFFITWIIAAAAWAIAQNYAPLLHVVSNKQRRREERVR